MKLRVINANLIVKLKTFYRERTAMFFTLAFPIILILVFGTIFLDRDKLGLDLYVQDLDHTVRLGEVPQDPAVQRELQDN